MEVLTIKGFALDNNGDILIANNEIQMVDGDELIRQTVERILKTNKGEWVFDWDEGIDFSNVLGKNITEDMVRSEIENGLAQVDESLNISDFVMTVNRSTRQMTVKFTATSQEQDTNIEVITAWD